VGVHIIPSFLSFKLNPNSFYAIFSHSPRGAAISKATVCLKEGLSLTRQFVFPELGEVQMRETRQRERVKLNCIMIKKNFEKHLIFNAKETLKM
jgi:hypothetical protein